jgi:hypothetical protein
MSEPRRHPPARQPAETVLLQVLYRDFLAFMSLLMDAAGRPLIVAAHHRTWGRLLATSRRLVLLAPRDHSKTTTVIAYLLWRLWRHGRDPGTGRLTADPTGTYSAILFSATHPQVDVLMATVRDLLLANAGLFEGLLPDAAGRGRARIAWSGTHIRLANGAELRARSFRTSTRGLHPDLIVLDDVLSDENTRSSHQRELSWRYFARTLLPMNPEQLVAIGTTLHRDDILQRLRPGGPAAALGFEWHAFRALDPETATTLWPERHPYAELAALRDADPIAFAAEYQNDPRDDAAAIFPYELTQRALEAGSELTFVDGYRPRSDEVVVLGFDPAVSESSSADFTVAIVVAYNWRTGARRVLTMRRHRGLDLAAQVALVRRLCVDYGVLLGIVEQNGSQRWLVEELARYTETAARISGWTTGRERMDLANGIPGLKLELLKNLWTVPCGDAASRALARAWQDELGAFGWRDGRLEGIGEHDDLVLASWFVELAIATALRLLGAIETEEIVTAEDLGIERYRISADLDSVDHLYGRSLLEDY